MDKEGKACGERWGTGEGESEEGLLGRPRMMVF